MRRRRSRETAKDKTEDGNLARKKKVGKVENGVKEGGGIICEGWRDAWRNASVNPCVRAAAQCQVSACEWACVTAVSQRPGRDAGRWERKSCSKLDNRNVFMSVTEQQQANKSVKH